jgi:hypothetical protein
MIKMGEDLYGKFGLSAALIGVILIAVTMFATFSFGLLIPNIMLILFMFLFLSNMLAIILGIVGIIQDNLRENAVRALVGGILFLIAGVGLVVVFNWLHSSIG